MIDKETPVYHEKDALSPLGLPGGALPTSQVRAFINHLTVEEAHEVGLRINVTMHAVNYLHQHGFDNELAERHLELIAQLAREHHDPRYRAFMAALRKICESKTPNLGAVVWTLIEANIFLAAAQPDSAKAAAVYEERIGIRRVWLKE